MYRELMDFTGRTAVVTGGAGGIGAACVASLREWGAHCVVVDLAGRDDEDVIRLDVSDPSAVAEAFQGIATEHEGIDILVTSAGIANHLGALEVAPEAWRRVLDVNASGTFWCAREAARHMRPGSSIVAIGSISGEIANAPQPQAAYNASKGAVHLIVRSLAIELAGQGIRVNAVAPGYVGTELTSQGVPAAWIEDWRRRTPQARLGRPEEIATVVTFLASAAASYMTGSIVTADGGYTTW